MKRRATVHGKSYAICLEDENTKYSTMHLKYPIILWSSVLFNAMHCKCNITHIAFAVLFNGLGMYNLSSCFTLMINYLLHYTGHKSSLFFSKRIFWLSSVFNWLICWSGWSQIRNQEWAKTREIRLDLRFFFGHRIKKYASMLLQVLQQNINMSWDVQSE